MGRFELPTFRLGGGRSIQLSYIPASLILAALKREPNEYPQFQRFNPFAPMSER
jgi:hypothetical protein